MAWEEVARRSYRVDGMEGEGKGGERERADGVPARLLALAFAKVGAMSTIAAATLTLYEEGGGSMAGSGRRSLPGGSWRAGPFSRRGWSHGAGGAEYQRKDNDTQEEGRRRGADDGSRKRVGDGVRGGQETERRQEGGCRGSKV